MRPRKFINDLGVQRKDYSLEKKVAQRNAV